MSVREIDREGLSARLARGENFKLVMASSDWGFRAKHIPGSVHFKNIAELFAAVPKDDEIVVYCSNADCHASMALIQKLRDHGYQKVFHYAGGIIDWEEGGLPIEGDWAAEPSPP
jgi:rhodanese-related sulfurtransferase